MITDFGVGRRARTALDVDVRDAVALALVKYVEDVVAERGTLTLHVGAQASVDLARVLSVRLLDDGWI